MIVRSFFYGHQLTLMEKLSIKSFIDNGHTFKLYTYNDKSINYQVAGLEIEDASQVIDHKDFFTYDGEGDCPMNSVGGFSDIFRFALLEKFGGWYVDMDVTCLKNFSELTDTCVLRPSCCDKIVANIIKSDHNDFNKSVLSKYKEDIKKDNNCWVKPLDILTNQAKQFDLMKYVVKSELFGDDNMDVITSYLTNNVYDIPVLPTYAIHWCNTACSTGNWDSRLKVNWNEPRKASLFYCLLTKHKLV